MESTTATERIMVGDVVPIDSIHVDPKNPRKGNISAIIDSLREFGQHRAVVVQRSSNQIIAGNHVWQSAKALRWDHIGVVFVDDDDVTAARRGLADNAVNDMASWEEQLLAELVEITGAVPGFSEKDIEDLNARLAEHAEKVEDDQAVYPIVPKIGEEYDYVLVVATNATDNAWLQTRFNIPPHKSYKNENIGRTHVIDVEEFRKLLGL